MRPLAARSGAQLWQRATRAAHFFACLRAAGFRFWPLLLPLALLLPALNSFPYPPAGTGYSDVVVSHYPNALYLRRALTEAGAMPLWSPAILSGHPFAANPLSGLWYPPGWLALLLPLPLGFNLLAAAHLLWGGLGAYRLLQSEGLSHPAALFGGLVFAILPKLFAHYGAGHLTLLYAVPWTPWLLYSLSGSEVKITGSPAGTAWSLKPAILLALIFLADPRWAVYAGVLFLFYYFARSHTFRGSQSLPPPSGRSFLGSLAQRFRPSLQPILFLVLLAGLLAAPLGLPLLEFARLSTRAQLTPVDSAAFSLPPARLLGLLFPAFGDFHEWILYPGALVILLAVLSLVGAGPGRAAVMATVFTRFWLATALLSLLVALGDQVPLLRGLGNLPGLDLLRVPSRALFLNGLALAMLSAQAAERLAAGLDETGRRRARLAITALLGFALVLAAGIWALAGKLPAGFTWGAALALAATAWILLRLGERLPARAWFSGLILLASLDLFVVDRTLFYPRPATLVLAEGREVAEFIAAQPGRFRVYSPSYSLPQQAAARAGLELADGVDPLQLISYALFMEGATGIPEAGYSVTLPPFTNGNPATANSSYTPDPRRLGLLNVRFVAAEYDLPVEGFELRGRFGDTRLYENRNFLPRAWLQPAAADPSWGVEAAEIVRWEPNSIELRVAKDPGPEPRLLVLSELAYPGWRVWVDGQEVPVEVTAGLLRSVKIGPGEHRVVFRFLPLSLAGGLILGALGWLWVLGSVLARRSAQVGLFRA